jgi:hypothetical protein
MKHPRLSASVAALVIGSLSTSTVYALEAATAADHARVQVSAEEILGVRTDLRGQIEQGLQDEKIIAELKKMGVAPQEVRQRLAGMTDRELQQVSQGVERTAGGDSVVIGTTTLLLIIIIIILVA